MTLYKDDTMTLAVGVIGLNASNRQAYEPLLFTTGNAQVEGLAPTFADNAFVWTLRFKTMGQTTLAASIDGAGVHEEWTREVHVYGDLTDFKQMLDRTSHLISADILEAGANVNDATAAYKAAYDQQKSILDKEAKDRRMLEDMLWDALFAGLGGLAGGAAGAAMGRWLGKELKETLKGGAAIDAVKDVTKSLTKSVAKMGKPTASIEDPELKPMSVEPLNFLLRWEAAARREGAFLLRQIAKVADYAGEAENEESTNLFDEDLYAILEADQALQFLKQPMSTDPRSYTRALWENWLGEYGYEFIDEHWEAVASMAGNAQPVFVEAFVGVGVTRGSKLEEAIIEAATSTGMSEAEAHAWYEEATRPAREFAESQLATRRAGREPTPRTPGRPRVPTGRPADSPKPTH